MLCNKCHYLSYHYLGYQTNMFNISICKFTVLSLKHDKAAVCLAYEAFTRLKLKDT